MCKHGLGGLIRDAFEDLLQKRMGEQLLGVGRLLVALEQVNRRHQRCPKPCGRLIGGGTGGLTGGARGLGGPAGGVGAPPGPGGAPGGSRASWGAMDGNICGVGSGISSVEAFSASGRTASIAI